MKWPTIVKNGNMVQNNNWDQTNRIDMTDMYYAAGMKTLSMSFVVHGSHHRAYTSQIVFLNIKEQLVETEEEAQILLRKGKHMIVTDTEKHNHMIEKPDLKNNDVQIRCGCESFEFTYAEYDKRYHAMTGRNFRPYHRKTNTRPPRNPQHLPGACKHLLIVMDYLVKRKGFVLA